MPMTVLQVAAIMILTMYLTVNLQKILEDRSLNVFIMTSIDLKQTTGGFGVSHPHQKQRRPHSDAEKLRLTIRHLRSDNSPLRHKYRRFNHRRLAGRIDT